MYEKYCLAAGIVLVIIGFYMLLVAFCWKPRSQLTEQTLQRLVGMYESEFMLRVNGNIEEADQLDREIRLELRRLGLMPKITNEDLFRMEQMSLEKFRLLEIGDTAGAEDMRQKIRAERRRYGMDL